VSHRFALIVIALLAVLAPCAVAARALASGHVTIELRAEVEAAQRQVRLGDVAYLRTTDLGTMQRLLALPLGEAPRAGSEAVLDRELLARWIRLRAGIAPELLLWEGAQRAVVRTPVQAVTPERIEGAARAVLEQWLSSRAVRFSVEAAGLRDSISLPPGRAELKVRPLPAGGQPASRMVVWVDAWVDGAFIRTVPVSFAVEAYGDAWVTVAPAPAGAALARPLLEQRQVSITDRRAAPLAAAADPAALQATRTLRAGDALTTQNTRTAAGVERGQWVTLKFSAGGLQLEGRAEALQEGEPGQTVRVRLAGATQPVEARVVERGRVEAMP